METFILDNKDTLEKMAAGTFSGRASHDFRKEFERIARQKGHKAGINWNCSCASVQNAAKTILRD